MGNNDIFQEDDSIFKEDDQAPLFDVLMSNPTVRKLMMDEKSPDGKPLMSHSFAMIDFSEGILRYPTQKQIMIKRMNEYQNSMKKCVYPEVKIMLEVEMKDKYSSIQLETYIRLKYRGKYYLYRIYKDSVIKPGIEREVEIMALMKHFYSEVYRYQTLMRVDLKMVIGHHDPPKPVFELDLDQISEEMRLLPESNYDPNRLTKR